MTSYLTEITNYLWRQSWQLAILVIGISVLCWILKNRSAHVHYLIWSIVLAKCLVPPFFIVPLAVLPQESMIEQLPILPTEPPAATIERVNTAITEPPISISTPVVKLKAARLTSRQWLGLIWFIGLSFFLIFALVKALKTNRWLLGQRKALPAKLQNRIEDMIIEFGLKRFPNIWLVEGIGQPFVWGLLRGSIYLPADFTKVENAEHRRGILGHELSHIIRFDAAINVLQVFAQALFWFHPFVWWANKKIRAEREKCCDEMAIARLGAEAKEYSSAVVNILISEYKSTRPIPSLAVAGRVKNIEERIRTMLRPGKKFYKRPSLIAATVVLLIAFLTAPTALVLTTRAVEDATENKSESVKLLHQAAAKGDIEQVKLLISKGANVNEKDKNGWTPLHTASYNEPYKAADIAEVLIAKGANINAKDVSGRTPLHVAASKGSSLIFKLLIAKGANINARDKRGNMPLHYAAGWRLISEDLLKLLIAKGADVNARNDAGQTPLHFAVSSRHAWAWYNRVVEFLLANGADINAKDKRSYTPLHVAAVSGRKEKKKERVELLLNKGAVLEQKNNRGDTALHLATIAGNKEVMELLLDRGADVNSTQWSGWSSLHYAARAGKNDIVKLLVDKGANVNAKNVRGETPAHLAAVQNHKDTVKLLISRVADVSSIQLAAYIGDITKFNSFIEKGISINAQDGYWLTPLHAAAGAGQKDVAEFLISKGASVNADAVGEGPGTPLHYAVDSGSIEVAELLVSKGAIIDARNRSGETPLHLAAKKGYSDLAKLFVTKKADVTVKTQDGWTPLHFAADNGHKNIVALLIENGADINAKSNEPKGTPLFYAARSGHKSVIKLLIDKGAIISDIDDLLYYACEYQHKDLVEFFIQKGANVNSEADYWGDAPALYLLWDFKSINKWDKVKIADSNQPDILKLLLDHGANPNAKGRADWSLLHYAAETEGYIDMARMLLDKGANPNIRESIGQTPLHLAAEPGFKAMVELLISRGADVNAKDYYGHTPLWYAEDHGSNAVYGYRDTPPTSAVKLAKKETADLLRQHGAKR